ncbi:uvrD/REP helicase family protein [Oleiphilus messinensis]|uniref:UvrD/REP helicase family protein n=1 Tax=Oleiphilus messinensis TaxID=141451 RepID=A0A1Y0I6K1_9GAMM|nr:UvrD-helicase domain-containing protein [Oleiphilus messinensis]ARU55860.1 uvrD/REP helicase family protein [Oleiphilus messinensis]
MDKRVVFAVAGSGKTSSILDSLNADSRCLIVTYTENNTRHLKNRVIDKFGEIPVGIRIYSYFTFLYSFCFRPLCGYELKTKGVNFNFPLPQYAQRSRKDTREHYIDKSGRLYANRIAKLLIEFDVVPDLIQRIEKFYDLVFIDEFQDFAANDFNLICALAMANVEMRLVGDFFQHTFDTSRDGNTQKSLHECFDKYCDKLKKSGFEVDLASLSNSYRCSPSVCAFVSENIGIKILSHREDEVVVGYVDNVDEVDSIFNNDSIVKLFYQKSDSYAGNTANWGNTKGLDHFQDVCVVLNPTTLKAFDNTNLDQLNPTTKNKLYVACTRAKGNLYFVSEKSLKKYQVS